MSNRISSLTVLAAAALVSCMAGCGGSDAGPTRYDVSGTVTFDGKPVLIGTVTFDPDRRKGNEGPQGYAEIKDGRYSTTVKGGKGAVGGPHVVIIDGYDEPVPTYDRDAGQEWLIPQPLFRDYRTEIELNRADSTVDFEVPKSAGVPAGRSAQRR